MHVRLLCTAALMSSLVVAAACGPSTASLSAPEIRLTSQENGGAAYVEVTGLSREQLSALEELELTTEQWSSVLRVAVGPDVPAMLGRYAVANGRLIFTPASSSILAGSTKFDSILHECLVSASPTSQPSRRPSADRPPERYPRRSWRASTPRAMSIPENMLRMYIEFSIRWGAGAASST